MTRIRRSAFVQSQIDEIRKLRLYPFTAEPIELVKVRSVDRTIVGVDAAGRVFTNGVRKPAYYVFNNSTLRAIFDACVTLGVLTKKAVDEHVALVAAETAATQRHYAAASVLGQAKKIGLKLTTAQIKKIEACRKPGRKFIID